MHHLRFFTIFQFLAPKKLFGGYFPTYGLVSFMKIRSAIPENGCLIFMHYRRIAWRTEKNICKAYTHSRPLAVRMRKITRLTPLHLTPLLKNSWDLCVSQDPCGYSAATH